MTPKPLPSPELLRQILRYDHEQGKLFWLYRDRSLFPSDWAWKVFNKQYPGREAMTAKNNHGYPHSNIRGASLTAHRVAWAIFYGSWPKDQLDHINNDRSDFRIANLREATNSQNHMNKPKSSANKSGFKGVIWLKKKGVWQATIKRMGKTKHLGYYASIEEAAKAYEDGAKIYHGEFARVE